MRHRIAAVGSCTTAGPRAWLTSREGRAARLHRFEVTSAFAAAVSIAHLASAFVVSRVRYWLCCLADWAPVRSLLWGLGMGLIVSLCVVPA
jgi:uncharacterized MAPEG superfamily protein